MSSSSEQPQHESSQVSGQVFEAAASAVMENIRQAGVGAHRKGSSPVSPTTIKESAQHVGQSSPSDPKPNVTTKHSIDDQHAVHDQDVAATPIPSSSDWRPFRVFSVRQHDARPNGDPACEPILYRQSQLFQKVEELSTTAARKYWRSLSSAIYTLSLITHRSALTSSQHFPSEGHSNVPATQQGDTDDGGSPLKEYMLRINDVLFRQARAESDNYHTAVTEALMQMMQLLTWAQKVETLAEGEGHGMSDDEIEEAVEGARDLLCWFQDDEGIDEFDGL